MMRPISARPRLALLTAGAAVLTGLGACQLPFGACTDELRIEFSPRERSLGIGESFTPVFRLSSCGGQKKLSTSITWQSADPAIASVDPQSGRITGVAPGQTSVTGTTDRYHVSQAVQVTVQAPSP